MQSRGDETSIRIQYMKREFMMQKKKSIKEYIGFGTNVVLNMFGSALPIAILQLFVLPTIASKTGSLAYGQIIAMIGLLSLGSEPFGSALNNSRLLMENKYNERRIKGDFNYLIVLTVPISILLVVFACIFYVGEIGFFTIVSAAIISTTILLQKYYMVHFRICLDYKMVLVNSIVLCSGYLIGLFLFLKGGSYLLVYLFGGALSLVNTLWRNPLLKEPAKKTALFNETARCGGTLLFVEFSNSFIKYADRLLLYPFLGGTAVSIYYSATVISKIINLTVAPISTVILSYFSRMKTMTKRMFCRMLVFTAVVGVAGYFVCIVISRPTLQLLYPNWFAESFALVGVTTATAVVDAISSVIRPAVLKFRNVKWQFLLGGSNLVLYTSLAYVCYLLGGIRGFCFGLLINSIIQLIMRVIIFLRQPRQHEL